MGFWDTLKEYAPAIAGAVAAGPVGIGTLATKVLLENIFEGDNEKKKEDLNELFVNDEIKLKIKLAEQQFLKEELDRELERTKLKYSDIADARDMQKEALKQDDVFSKRFIYYFASFWSVVSVIYIYMITFSAIPENNVRFADTILGFVLGTVIATILQFFLGGSLGSNNKNDTIKQALNNLSNKK
jgi:hypothetical protein